MHRLCSQGGTGVGSGGYAGDLTPPTIYVEGILICISQCCGLRPWSYDKTGLRPVLVLVLVLQFRSWSWSCTSGLGLGLNILVLFPIVHLMQIRLR